MYKYIHILRQIYKIKRFLDIKIVPCIIKIKKRKVSNLNHVIIKKEIVYEESKTSVKT